MPPPVPRVPILSVSGLTKTFAEREILKDLSFTLFADAKMRNHSDGSAPASARAVMPPEIMTA